MAAVVRGLLVAGLLTGGVASAATAPFRFSLLAADANRLVLLDPESGEHRDLGLDAWSFDWAPDGSRIAFVRPGGHLWLADVDESSSRELVSTPRVGPPRWSPDGSTIAFTATLSAAQGRLYVVRADGSGLRGLARAVAPRDPRWSPDGDRLLFHGRIRRATWALFVVEAGSGRVRRLAAPTHPSAPAEWSPDGRWISFVERGRRLNVVRADGSARRRLADLVVWGAHAWAPDGARLAFVSQRFLSSDVWTVEPRNGRLRRLTRGSEHHAFDSMPAWSRDATKIAFTSTRAVAAGRRDLYVMNGDGTCESRLLGGQVGVAPAWRPGVSSGRSIRCHDLRLEGTVDVEASRVTRNHDRIYRLEVVVRNDGTEGVAASRVVLGSHRPREIEIVSAAGEGASCSTGENATCDVVDIESGASRRLVLRFSARPQGAPLALDARVTTAEQDVEPLGNAVTVLQYVPFCRWTDVGERSAHAPPYGRGELVCGTDGRDTIVGSSTSEIIVGARGPDRIFGGGGGDTIGGENGNDRLDGGRGADVVSGGSGDDVVRGGAGPDGLSGGSGRDLVDARDGVRDYVWCAGGRDRVLADRHDTVARDCEQVRRSGGA